MLMMMVLVEMVYKTLNKRLYGYMELSVRELVVFMIEEGASMSIVSMA